ncbi:MAG: prolipoprotein diacylglyceryl transferase [Chloroflexi bacterium]|nr:prolipoprotein diacylglyceryl transferase [Chloroflexota bacterium]
MFPFLRLGPFLLQLPGLALLAGVWLGSSLAEKEAARINVETPHVASLPAAIYNLIFYGLIAGIVGARLTYAARYLSAYLANPLSLFALTPNTLWPGAGLVIGIAVAALYGRRKGLPFRPTLDALAPALAAFMAALGVAHFLSGDAFGAPAYGPGSVALPWAIYLWDDYRHPTQIYETLAALAVLFITLKRPLAQPREGLNFLLVVALSAAARVFLEAFRGDSVIWAGGFRAAQVIALFVLAASLWLMRVRAQPTTLSAVET